jgi:hypothetical protein
LKARWFPLCWGFYKCVRITTQANLFCGKGTFILDSVVANT